MWRCLRTIINLRSRIVSWLSLTGEEASIANVYLAMQLPPSLAPQLLHSSLWGSGKCLLCKKDKLSALGWAQARDKWNKSGEIITPQGRGEGPSPHSLASSPPETENSSLQSITTRMSYPTSDLKHELLSFYYYYYNHDISPSALSGLTRWPAVSERQWAEGGLAPVPSAQIPPSLLLLLPWQLTLNTTIGTTFRQLGRSVNNGPSHADQSPSLYLEYGIL